MIDKVDIMIVGAQKSGTTTLFNILRSHPEMSGCKVKEPMFFSKSEDWRNEIDQYHSLFDDDDKIHFEASTGYTFYPLRNLNVWDDMYEYNPDLKFIYIVRKPEDRIVSSYMHNYERGYIESTLEKALVEYPLLLYLTRYHMQIKPFIERFGREQVLLLDFDDFNNNRDSVMAQVAKFIGVDASGFDDFKDVHLNKSLDGHKLHHKFDNPSLLLRALNKMAPAVHERIVSNSKRAFSSKPMLDNRQKELVYRFLEQDIEGIEQLMGKDLSHWRG